MILSNSRIGNSQAALSLRIYEDLFKNIIIYLISLKLLVKKSQKYLSFQRKMKHLKCLKLQKLQKPRDT